MRHFLTRFSAAPLSWVFLCVSFLTAQQPVVYRVEGNAQPDQFGWAVTVLSDIDGDGEVDLPDVAQHLFFCFRGDWIPAPPYPECGRFGGLRKDPLTCEESHCAR